MAAALWLNSVLLGEVPSTMETKSAAAPDHRALALWDVVSLSTPASAPEALAVTSSQPSLPTIALPTPSLVQAASLRIQQEGGTLTEQETVAVLTEAGWPVELHGEALAVTFCESRWSPYADNGTDKGLFQMSFAPDATTRGSWYAYFGVDESLWNDAVTNATVARWAYERSRWGNWSCKP